MVCTLKKNKFNKSFGIFSRSKSTASFQPFLYQATAALSFSSLAKEKWFGRLGFGKQCIKKFLKCYWNSMFKFLWKSNTLTSNRKNGEKEQILLFCISQVESWFSSSLWREEWHKPEWLVKPKKHIKIFMYRRYCVHNTYLS